ncbi:MAG: sugar transferase [Nanoarchaeota archaeon]|nr:sugar transferase [Nanoarchaeota archaeon]MBU1005772.1 sugar transferase [Nanoarchaeota archaeon]MBU1946643.1 sugar transferase [Nanoarchaeota archaeon]
MVSRDFVKKGFYCKYGKRILDISVSFIFIISLLPVIAPILLIMKIFGCRRIIFKQKRAGKNRRAFTMYKFRTMVPGAEKMQEMYSHLNESDGPTFKIRDDPRLTSFGKWLRDAGLDELPQLINVLEGSMSLVGPRPHPCKEVLGYKPWQMERLSAKPGITSLWHVSGRHKMSFDLWVKSDIYYIKNQSLFLDIQILIKTFALFLRQLFRAMISPKILL